LVVTPGLNLEWGNKAISMRGRAGCADDICRGERGRGRICLPDVAGESSRKGVQVYLLGFDPMSHSPIRFRAVSDCSPFSTTSSDDPGEGRRREYWIFGGSLSFRLSFSAALANSSSGESSGTELGVTMGSEEITVLERVRSMTRRAILS
jgi:hypothetical protein